MALFAQSNPPFFIALLTAEDAAAEDLCLCAGRREDAGVVDGDYRDCGVGVDWELLAGEWGGDRRWVAGGKFLPMIFSGRRCWEICCGTVLRIMG